MTPPEIGAKVQGQPRSRRQRLEEFVASHPADSFARYGLAMECAKADDHAAAEKHFRQIITEHAEYVAAYFQFGQLLARLGRLAEARAILSEGVVRAGTAGDAHARSEMQSALDQLG